MIKTYSRARRRPVGRTLSIALAAFACATTSVSATAAEPTGASAILKSMSDYLASQQSFAADFDLSLEVVTPELEKIQFAASGTAQVARPNKLRMARKGGYSDVELVFDGETVTVVDRFRNFYGQRKLAGTLDTIVDQLRSEYLIEMPAADLLLTNSYDELTQDVIEAKHIGIGVVNGVDCNHLAFRNHDTDWQIWVRTGDKPLPCKLIITSKTVSAAPQYVIQFKEWRMAPKTDNTTFAFSPAAGAKPIAFENISGLGELPPPAPFKGSDQ